MVIITLSKYRTIDLCILGIIGIAVDIAGMFCITRVFQAIAPRYCVAILIIIIAVCRWNKFGLFLIPIFALTTYLTGSLLLSRYINDEYSIVILFCNLIGFCACAIPLLFKMKFGKKVFSTIWNTIGIIALVVFASAILQGIVYSIFERMNFFKSIGFNLVQAIPSLVISLILAFVLKPQNIFVDVKANLIEKKNEAIQEKEYYSKFINDEIVIKNESVINKKDDKTSK